MSPTPQDRRDLRVLWIVLAGFLIGVSILAWAIVVDVMSR